MLLLNIIILSTEHINVTTANNNVTTEHKMLLLHAMLLPRIIIFHRENLPI